MIVLTNVARLYDGTSDEAKSVKTGVDLWIEDGLIADVTEHNKQGINILVESDFLDASTQGWEQADENLALRLGCGRAVQAYVGSEYVAFRHHAGVGCRAQVVIIQSWLCPSMKT